MSSKPRRGTVRWSHQRCTTSRTTNALLLTSLTVFLSNLLSTAHGNPMHPFSSALAIGRNLRHLPCVVRSTGDEGICMFAIDCFKANGTHLGVCIDKIFFGSCCQVRDESLLFNHEITDNSIDHNHSSGLHFQHITHSLVDTNKKPPLTETRLPTTTVTPQNATKYVPSSTSSTTTLRTTTKFVRRNVTSPTTTVKAEVKDDVPSDYQEFSTFQYVQGSKNPELTTTGAIRRTTTKPVTKPTTRKPPPRTTISPNKTRKPVPSRNNTRAPVTPMTTPKTVVTTLTEAKKNVSSYTTVTRRPVTPSETTTHSSRRPTTASSTTVRRTTTLPKRPVTMAVSSEETSFHSFTRRPTTQPTIIPMTRPVHRRRPTTTPTEEPETTRAPRPRPRPTPEIATVPATALDHLLDDLITTTLREGTSAESSNVKTTSSSRYPITTVKITEATTPTPTPTTTTTTTTRKSTIPSTTTAELTSPAKATTTTTQTTTTRTTTPTTTSTTTTTEKPTTTTTVKSTVPTTTTTSTSTTAPTTATTTTTTTSVPETTATNIKTTTSSTPTTPKTTTTTVGKTTTTSPKTTTSGRITPPADIDYPPETSQLHNLLDETTAGSGLVTWSSIVDYVSSEKQPPEQAATTNTPAILIEILGPSTPAPKEPSSTQPATSPTSTVEELITETTEEGSTEEGSGSEEESSEEETFSSGSYETTSEPTSPTPVLLSELDKWGNTTLISSLGTTESSSSSESSTVITSSTTLNITSSLQSIASMFNISTSTGMPVRFPIDNSTGTSSPAATDGVTISPDFITTSTVPSLEGIDYRAVCGKRMFPEPRIVGGTKASFGRWPWQISLRQWRTSTYLHKCGAALLNENWAITAAHCVDNVPPSDLLLRLGEYDLALEEEPYGYQERRVQIVASHPQFDPRTFEYDLALLRFYEPVIFQPNIIPVCVPDGDENFIGRTAFVTGWGRLYEDGPLPSVLQEVTVPVIENKICETMYRSAGYIEHIPHIFICAGWKKGGYDSCEGDSGGPMVIQRPDKRFLLAGVISWGIGCAEANQPGVYTRISEFRDWINQILQF
ncbi:serine proteinase stubble isoform X4 [Malaya genurostris]|uniref:serine proteinase stubble isoform X4 n=1 Tax=Malaya genurostris TaxID=325434 RepID=UPI0026F3DD11|nr:serine proteinase stubble isoform X4 [Malaya genurostris]